MIFDVSEKLAESGCKKSLINLRYQATTRAFSDKIQEWNNFASEGYACYNLDETDCCSRDPSFWICGAAHLTGISCFPK